MTLLRPEVAAKLIRWREVIAAGSLVPVGLWMGSLGGYLLVPVGVAVVALGLGWIVVAARRQTFARPVSAPGFVELDEGQIGYFGPSFGGFVALSDISEIRLADLHGIRQWRLRTADGQVLLVPVAAAGAERLYDAFALLPGIDMATLASALGAPARITPVWRRSPIPPVPPRPHGIVHHDKS